MRLQATEWQDLQWLEVFIWEFGLITVQSGQARCCGLQVPAGHLRGCQHHKSFIRPFCGSPDCRFEALRIKQVAGILHKRNSF